MLNKKLREIVQEVMDYNFYEEDVVDCAINKIKALVVESLGENLSRKVEWVDYVSGYNQHRAEMKEKFK